MHASQKIDFALGLAPTSNSFIVSISAAVSSDPLTKELFADDLAETTLISLLLSLCSSGASSTFFCTAAFVCDSESPNKVHPVNRVSENKLRCMVPALCCLENE